MTQKAILQAIQRQLPTLVTGGVKVADTSSGDLQQKLLTNRTLSIITTTMDPWIDVSISTCSGTHNTLATPLMKEVIVDAARSSAQVLWNPRNVIRTGRGGTTPGNTLYYVRYPRYNSPVMIGVIGVSPTSGHSGRLHVFNK